MMDTAGTPVILVTGASRGIGRAVCELLAGQGAQLVMVARDEQALQALAAVLVEHGAPEPLLASTASNLQINTPAITDSSGGASRKA